MIRAITLGIPLFNVSTHELAETAFVFQNKARKMAEDNGWPARTARFSLPPLLKEHEAQVHMLPALLSSISRIADQCGVRWFCLPVDLLDGEKVDGRLNVALESITREKKMFLNLMVADKEQIGIEAAMEAAAFILNVSRKSNNGFDNFRVGASCNCPENTPFFPFSRHEGNFYRFSIALETTELALNIANRQSKTKKISLAEFRTSFIEELKKNISNVDAFGKKLSLATGAEYVGLDASLAPFPDGSTSVGCLLERIGASPVGSYGTLFLTSMLTDAIKSAISASQARTTGFNGVMYSLLEDDYLSKANNQRKLSIESLYAYSTMCGCGLDMIPVPGSTFKEDIAAIILDVAALAVRLQKSLGVRLLPIPGKSVNEFTEFNVDFMCDSRVMRIDIGDSRFDFTAHSLKYLHQKLN